MTRAEWDFCKEKALKLFSHGQQVFFFSFQFVFRERMWLCVININPFEVGIGRQHNFPI